MKRTRERKLTRMAITSGFALVQIHHAEALAADSPTAPESVQAAVQEIIVTAQRRATSIEQVPYNISAIGGDELARTGTTDLRHLATQVPGFDLLDRGGQFEGSSVPIIRGLNASSTVRPGLMFEQSPVATYIGNSPVEGFFPIDDLQRVEILRGPQGTLYGAGALGGAIRLLPNDPILGKWAANLSGSGGSVAHSSGTSYSYSGLLNIPLGEIAALRVTAKYDHEAGFIDQIGVEKRQGNPITSAPVLANPQDVANSSGLFYNLNDSNWTTTRSGRAMLLVQPTDALKIELAFNYAQLNGQGGPTDTPFFPGGADPLDPRVTFPQGGNYRLVNPTLEPYSRDSHLTTLDVSYDAGFATASSTTTYYEVRGATGADTNPQVFQLSQPGLQYYVGNPISPRFVATSEYGDSNRTEIEELRLVSNGHHTVDYVAGAYFEHQARSLSWDLLEPGASEQAAAIGGFPINTDPLGRTFSQTSPSKFTEEALYGEGTWNITSRLSGSVGARVFHQKFSQEQSFNLFFFDGSGVNTTENSVTNHIFKVNGSYEYLDRQHVYATFSQGFRRGGANAFVTDGIYREPQSLVPYAPDKANNYEVGLKGVLPSGMRYTADVFRVDWNNAQIGAFTPNGWAGVFNAPKARSQGAEFELHTPVIIPALQFTVGYSYIDAKLTKNFCLPSGNGSTDGYLPCGIFGTSGEVLPGTPKNSGIATLDYTQKLLDSSTITYSLNGTYKGSTLNSLPVVGYQPVYNPGYVLANASATFQMKQWSVGVISTNILDRRAVLAAPLRPTAILGTYADVYTVTQPRTISLRVGYDFEP
jgi:iron complex outermembrane recepter protein